MKDRHVYLVGFMGSGKSTVGPILADLLGCGFIDLDDCIVELAGRSIPEIFATQGEREFRRLETVCLKRVAGRSAATVVALGGGVLESLENRETIAQSGRRLWLKVGLKEAWSRCRNDSSRPLARSRAEFERRFRLRQALYAESEWRVETTGACPKEIAKQAFRKIFVK